jgi:RimJ/RimL family protein N-acetyltransferase
MNVPVDYPSEFSAGVAANVGGDGAVGPYFILRSSDGLLVGEIGGAFVDKGVVEIGYAIVDSQSGRGLATAAVSGFAEIAAQDQGEAQRLIAHTPLDRPASGRVVEKAGFERLGIVEDEHEGEVLSVYEWVLRLR